MADITILNLNSHSCRNVQKCLNHILTGKRPISSMVPSIVVSLSGDVRLVLGGAGGPKITTSVALVVINDIWFDMGLDMSVSASRLHHQLYPMTLVYEKDTVDKVRTKFNVIISADKDFVYRRICLRQVHCKMWPQMLLAIAFTQSDYRFYTYHTLYACSALFAKVAYLNLLKSCIRNN